MHFYFLVSDDSTTSYDDHRQTTFFRSAPGNSLSLAYFSIFFDENLASYSSNIVLLHGN